MMEQTADKFASVCHICGGFGKDGGCPSCGLTPRERVAKRTTQIDIPLDIIPVSYQGKIWERPVPPEGTILSAVAQDFDTKLERVGAEFLAGRIPKFSMYIGAPDKYGKHAFAYSCIQTAMVQNFSAAPLLSTSDWRRLYKVSQMNPFYKLYGKYRWDNLVSRQVLFLTVDHSDDRFDVVSLLKDILDTRAGFNLPTFILSDYKLTELVTKWQSEEYQTIYNPDPQRDLLRYPVIIQRF